MRVRIIAVGRLKSGPEQALATRYAERFGQLARKVGLAGPEVVELDESGARRADDRTADEARAIRARVPVGARVLVLDERGRTFTSEDFAAEIGCARDGGIADYCCVIGGPDGLSPVFRADADASMAMGALTWPHRLVRVMLAEQLYRVATILGGHPYHRG